MPDTEISIELHGLVGGTELRKKKSPVLMVMASTGFITFYVGVM